MALQRINWTQIDSANVPTGYTVDIGKIDGPINTIYSENIFLSGISITDLYLNKGIFNNGVLTLTSNSGNTITVSGFDVLSGLTVTGTTNLNFLITNSISATTISGGTLYGDGSNLTNIDNIYTVDGELTGNRKVNLKDNILVFDTSSRPFNDNKVIFHTNYWDDAFFGNDSTVGISIGKTTGDTISKYTVDLGQYSNLRINNDGSQYKYLSAFGDFTTSDFQVGRYPTGNLSSPDSIFVGGPETGYPELPSTPKRAEGFNVNIFSEMINIGHLNSGSNKWLLGNNRARVTIGHDPRFQHGLVIAPWYLKDATDNQQASSLQVASSRRLGDNSDTQTLWLKHYGDSAVGARILFERDKSSPANWGYGTNNKNVSLNDQVFVINSRVSTYSTTGITAPDGRPGGARIRSLVENVTITAGASRVAANLILDTTDGISPTQQERLRIVGTTGNILINTSSDSGFKLDVNGTGRFSSTLQLDTVNLNTTDTKILTINPSNVVQYRNLSDFTGSTITITGGTNIEITGAHPNFGIKFNGYESLAEYYVDRRFSGGCEVTIDSNKTITSTNPDYITQYSNAKVGDPNNPFPDPWSASFSAAQSISGGTISKARIIIKTNNEYTYGSSILTQNGDITGSTVNNVVPDIAVSQIDYDNRVFDLLSPNIEFYFEPETALYNINKSWTQELVRYISTDWTVAPEFKITGQGKFVLVYGQAQGFICRYGTIAAPRAEIKIEADMMLQNMWHGWTLIGQKIDIDVNKWWSYLSKTMTLNALRDDLFQLDDEFWNWPAKRLLYPSYSIGQPIVNVNINDYKWGETLFGGIAPHAADFWVNIVMGHPYGTTYNINIKNLTTQGRHTDGFFRLTNEEILTTINSATTINNNININIEYILASKGNLGSNNIGGQLFHGSHPRSGSWDGANPSYFENCNWFINIGKMDSFGVGLGVGGGVPITNMSNSLFKLNCDDYRSYERVRPDNTCLSYTFNYVNPSSLPSQNQRSLTNNKVIISGNYRNFGTGGLLSFGSANRLGDDNTIGSSLILDNFNGYQLNEIDPSFNLGTITVRNWSPFWPTYVFSTGSTLVVKNSTIFASGNNDVFRWRNSGTGNKTPTILLDDLLTNKDISGNFIFEGSMSISSNLAKLLY